MANSVTFPEALGGNGQTYTDDADPDTGLDGLGYTVRFIPCLQQAVVMGLSAQSSASAASGFVQQCQTLRQEVATDRQAVAADRTHVNQQKGLVDTAAEQVATDKQTVAADRTHVNQQKGLVDGAAEQVATDRQAVADDRTHVDQQKGLVDDAAAQVAIDRQAVAYDRGASEQAAGASIDAAVASIEAKNQSEALYGDLNAVETAKTQAQQAATDAGEERGLAETARSGAEDAQAASEQAASASQQAANTAISEHVDEEDPHSQYAKKDELGAAASRGVVGGEGALMVEGFRGLGTGDGKSNAFFGVSLNVFTISGTYFIGGTGNSDTPSGSSMTTCSLVVSNNNSDSNRIYHDALERISSSVILKAHRYSNDGGITWSPWDISFGTRNSVGVVSQIEGVPTGAIAQIIFAASGVAFRYIGGLQVCIRNTLALQYINSSTLRTDWTFPAPFVNGGRIVDFMPLRQSGGSAPPSSYRGGIEWEDQQGIDTLTTARIALLSSGSFIDEGSLNVQALAVGRWHA